MKNIIKKIMVGAVYFTTFGASIAIFAGNILYRFALGAKKRKHGRGQGMNAVYDRQDKYRSWILKHGKDVYITSADGLRLHALEIEAKDKTEKCVIVCHGYKSRAEDMGADAFLLHEQGFHVLVPDARGHGESEGDYIGMGWMERRDIIDWSRRLVENDGDSKIALYGVSMGAATVMMASGESDLPGEVKAIVEDCGYTSVWEEFKIQVVKKYHLPVFPFLHIARLITKVRAGYDFKEASAIKQVEKSKTPILFIHGDADAFVPFEMMNRLYEAAACEKEKLVIPEARHAQAGIIDKECYWNTVLAFLDKYVG